MGKTRQLAHLHKESVSSKELAKAHEWVRPLPVHVFGLIGCVCG